MKYLLDTNVISELIARKPEQKVLDWVDNLDPESCYLSVLTIGELAKGIEKLAASRRQEQLRSWLNTELLRRFDGKIVMINTEVMLIWAELIARLEYQGRPIPAIDSLIAASVLFIQGTLVTRNEDDFQHCELMVMNPWKLM